MTRRFFTLLVLLVAVFAFFPQVGQAQFARSKSALIQQSYQVAFCRLPSDSERRSWMNQSDSRVSNLDSLLRAHREWLRNQSSEKYQVTVRAFQQALGRMPNPGEVSYWNNLLSQGGTTCDDMVNTIGRERDRDRYRDNDRDNDRYRDNNRDRDNAPYGGAKAAMITQSYQIAFCRQPSDTEFRGWVTGPDSRTVNLDMVLRAHRSWLQNQGNEKREATIRAFQQALGRRPSSSELGYWTNQLSQGSTNCQDIVNTLQRGGRWSGRP